MVFVDFEVFDKLLKKTISNLRGSYVMFRGFTLRILSVIFSSSLFIMKADDLASCTTTSSPIYMLLSSFGNVTGYVITPT